MRIFGLDTSLKWINFEVDGIHYSVHFKESFLKGVYEVSIWKGTGKVHLPIQAKIESAYPTLKKRIKEIGMRFLVHHKIKIFLQ